MKHYLGVDPGKDGGFALMNSEGRVLMTGTVPKIKNEIDVKQLCLFFENICSNTENIFIILENVHSVQNSSAKGNFQFGRIVGIIESLVYVYGIPFQKINPKLWQKHAWIGVDPIKKNYGKEKISIDTKATSLIAVQRLYPNADLKLSKRVQNPNHNVVDAILLAHYGRISNL